MCKDSKSFATTTMQRSWRFAAFALLFAALAIPVLVRMQRAAAIPDTWSPAASLVKGRFDHTATLLPSGKVLVEGGYACCYIAWADAELYNPVTNSWSYAGSPLPNRANHTATLLLSGKVLVAGGNNSPSVSLTTAQLYDPVTNTWSAAGSLAVGRTQHTATLLADGKVLAVGGGTGSGLLTSAELYDPVTNTWSPAGSMSVARSEHTATLLPTGEVLVAGGWPTLGSAELYDPATNTWSAAASMATTRSQHTATLLQNGNVLAVGGFDGVGATTTSELYDPAANTWSLAGALTAARYEHTATLLQNGQVLVAAGATPGVHLNSAELYNPLTNVWSGAGSLVTARTEHAATLLSSGKVLATGGNIAPSPPTTSSEIYEPCVDVDGDCFTDVAYAGHQGPANTDYARDNCIGLANRPQTNTDGNHVDTSPPYVPATDDKTWPMSDAQGDACDLDDDNDGLSDADEATGAACGSIATNPQLFDTDGDQARDGAECSVGTSPVNPSVEPTPAQCGVPGDADGDKISDRVEFCYYGSNPASADSDGDQAGGLDGDGGKDGCEVASINADQIVSSGDQGKLASAISGGLAAYHPGVDLDKSGIVNSGDQGLMASFISPPGQCP